MCEVSALSFHHAPTAASIPLSLIHPALHEKLLQPCRVLRGKRQACEMYHSVRGRLGA